MDRVLLIIDDIQYSRHVEMTLRKVGFDVETMNNEFNLSESILTFNPDFIICRGNTNRLSAHSIGRKLKETTSKFNGKVLLIFPDGYKVTPEDLIKLRMDLTLFDPMSTLKLAMHLFSFSEHDFDLVRDKLLKFAITDNQFRNYEQQILKGAGKTIDSEIQIISSMDRMPADLENIKYKSPSIPEELTPENLLISSQVTEAEPQVNIVSAPYFIERPEAIPSFPEPESLSAETIEKINQEIQALEQELPLRIDTYNHTVKDTEQNMNVGLKKRQTKKALNKLQIELINEKKSDEKSELKLHDEKIRFTQALFKKKS